ncbi:hypothetical protein [Telmatospirillum sp. J64-1]|uniref:hypothetical protein n=1 Tax=Telmatospirillum sp. J64-1 TaxID=2502183 RepID=UPI00115D0646|nr:hypothetical protein [Telmatospirillum sp. J64-1]
MTLMAKVGTGLSAALVAISLAGPSMAQISDQPFSFSRAGQEAVGMSMAYRQAMLRDRLEGIRPNQMIRTPQGMVLDVERFHGQAFMRQPAAPYLPREQAYWGENTQPWLWWSRPPAAPDWFSGLSEDGPITAATAPTSASSIDRWIAQLDDLGRM